MNEMKQPESMRLACAMEGGAYLLSVERDATAAELRRLHAKNSVLVTKLSNALEEVNSVKSMNQGLLDALKDCLAKGNRWHPCDPVVAKAKAAIAKATGEQA